MDLPGNQPMRPELPEEYREFLALLHAKRVRYMLVGGYAVVYHGYPRVTFDMDVWVDPENLEGLLEAVRAHGSNDLFLESSRIRKGNEARHIETLTGISGLEFEECYAARIEDELDGIPLSVISLAHLKENNQASGRPGRRPGGSREPAVSGRSFGGRSIPDEPGAADHCSAAPVRVHSRNRRTTSIAPRL
jgi:hypothetical protein